MGLSKNKDIIKYAVTGGMSFLTMLAIAMVSGFGITGIDIVLPCLFALAFIVFLKVASILENENSAVYKKDMKFTIPLGIIVSIATVVGSKIDIDAGSFGDFGIIDILYILILLPFCVSLLILLFFSSDAISKKINENGVVKGFGINRSIADKLDLKLYAKKIAVYGIVMLICWLPYYLTYFPGGVSNDDYECLNMIYGNIPWTNHHPILFAVTIKLFVDIFATHFGASFALGMMALAQMIVLAFTFGNIIIWLECRGAGRKVVLLSVLFFALHPANAMMTIYLTKDIAFACSFIFLTLFLFDYLDAYKYESKKLSLKLCLWLGGLSLFTVIARNNGTIVIAITLFILILMCKSERKQLICVAVVVFALTAIYKGPVWKSLEIEKQSFVESASIPLTQIAYTVSEGGTIPEEDRAYLESIMPLQAVKERFVLGNIDTYKFDEEFNTEIVDDDPGKLISVWSHILPHNFGLYVEAYLAQTSGYWHYGETNTLCTEGVQPNDLGIEGTNVIENITGVSLWGPLSGLMLVVRKLPVLCFLTQMPIQLLAFVVMAIQFVRRKKVHLISCLAPSFAIWVSIMLAVPSSCLFRYMYTFFLMWPIVIFGFFATEEKK